MAKATTTMKQALRYRAVHVAWFAATQALFNQVAAFYFEVIQAHEHVLDLSNTEALTALERLTHRTKKNPTPVIPLCTIGEDIPAMFRRAAINGALGSDRSFYAHHSSGASPRSRRGSKGRNGPSTLQARHGAGNAQGTAQDTSAGMAADASGIPHPLRLFTE